MRCSKRKLKACRSKSTKEQQLYYDGPTSHLNKHQLIYSCRKYLIVIVTRNNNKQTKIRLCTHNPPRQIGSKSVCWLALSLSNVDP